METLPDWMRNLDEEDSSFIKKFLLSSGSLKEIAKLYGVSYPTVRLRLDRLIQKIKLSEEKKDDPYVQMIQELAIEEKIDVKAAKQLIHAYLRQKKEWKLPEDHR